MRNHWCFQNRANRDQKYQELKAAGRNVYRTVLRNQLLHPQYVEDFEGPAKHDTGFGNQVYKTYFSRLYLINERG